MPLAASYVDVGKNASSKVGDGRTALTAYDYFHINAVDKTSDGNYLISSRHTCTIFKVSSKDGSIIWRLGGKSSDFTLDGFNFSF